MLIPIHPGCGGIVRGLEAGGRCDRCGKEPGKIFQFDDPTLPCKECRRRDARFGDEKRGHGWRCKTADRRMKTGECCWVRSVTDPDHPTVACFSVLE